MAESCNPELLANLSTAKSPSAMMGAVVKNYWAARAGVAPQDVCLVSVMPCVRKQGEADRPWFNTTGLARDIDHVITTRDLGQLLRDAGVADLLRLPPAEFDDPLGQSSGAGALFGTTGGVMEAALRAVYELCTGDKMPVLEFEAVRGLEGLKEATVCMVPREGGPLGPAAAGQTVELKVAVVHGLKNVKQLVADMEEGKRHYHFVEVMACPGGCIAGAGQPVSKDRQAVAKRQGALYAVDASTAGHVHSSTENEALKELYDNWLGAPGSPMAHELLHTHYVPGGMEALRDETLARNAAQCAADLAEQLRLHLQPPPLGPGFPPPPPPAPASGPEQGQGGLPEECAALWSGCQRCEDDVDTCQGQ